MENKKIIITTESGEKKEGELLFSFVIEGEDFVLYELDDAVFAAKYDEKSNLGPIMEDEWPIVEKIYNDYMMENSIED